MRVLIDAGADTEARDNHVGQTPLIFAAMHAANADVIAELLAGGASVKAKDNNGNTALFYAKKNTRTDGWRLLRDAEKTKRKLQHFQCYEAQQTYDDDEYPNLDPCDGPDDGLEEPSERFDPALHELDDSDDWDWGDVQERADKLCDEIRASLYSAYVDRVPGHSDGVADAVADDDIEHDPSGDFERTYRHNWEKRNRLTRLIERVQARKRYDEELEEERHQFGDSLDHGGSKGKGVMRLLKSGRSRKNDDCYQWTPQNDEFDQWTPQNDEFLEGYEDYDDFARIGPHGDHGGGYEGGYNEVFDDNFEGGPSQRGDGRRNRVLRLFKRDPK